MTSKSTQTGERPKLPAGAYPIQVNWRYAVVLTLLHLLCLLALVPWLFSWLGVACLAAGYFVFGMGGITIGYHRLLSHKSFSCPKPLEYFFALLGICCLQESPVRWVAIHRMHHRHSDEQPDPHSPAPNFVWGHFGWLYVINRDHWLYENYTAYARDLMRQPFYAWVERYLIALWLYVLHAVLFFLFGFGVGWWSSGDVHSAVQLGLSVLVWGVFVRTMLFLHATWSVNSMAHLWGYRNFDTPDNSRNNWLFGYLSLGDGWHNNHHAHQRWARHGLKWWEFDASYLVIRTLEKLGLAWDVIRPKKSEHGRPTLHNEQTSQPSAVGH